jgi:hypothetical protein
MLKLIKRRNASKGTVLNRSLASRAVWSAKATLCSSLPQCLSYPPDNRLAVGRPFRAILFGYAFPGLKPWAILF